MRHVSVHVVTCAALTRVARRSGAGLNVTELMAEGIVTVVFPLHDRTDVDWLIKHWVSFGYIEEHVPDVAVELSDSDSSDSEDEAPATPARMKRFQSGSGRGLRRQPCTACGVLRSLAVGALCCRPCRMVGSACCTFYPGRASAWECWAVGSWVPLLWTVPLTTRVVFCDAFPARWFFGAPLTYISNYFGACAVDMCVPGVCCFRLTASTYPHHRHKGRILLCVLVLLHIQPGAGSNDRYAHAGGGGCATIVGLTLWLCPGLFVYVYTYYEDHGIPYVPDVERKIALWLDIVFRYERYDISIRVMDGPV